MLTTVDIHAFLKERIDPDAQREGQELVHSEKVTITKLTSQVAGGIVEGTSVQIQFTPEKVYIHKDCSCTTRKCRHIPALLQVISESQKNTFSNKAGYWRRVIDEMDSEGMKSFILEQVKRSKATSFDLRAFILRQEGIYSVNRAKEIFDELKSPVVRSTKNPTAPQVRLFGQITKTTMASAKELVQQGFIYQGISVSMLLVESLHYLFFRLKRNNSAVLNHLLTVEQQISAWFPLIRAPESQYDIVESWIELTSKSYFIPIRSEHVLDFFTSLPSEDIKQQVFQQIEKLIKEKTGHVHGIWVQIWMSILLNHKEITPSIQLADIHEHKREMIWNSFLKYPLNPNLEPLFKQVIDELTPRQWQPTLDYLIENKNAPFTIYLLSTEHTLLFNSDNQEFAQKLHKVAEKDESITDEQRGSILANTGNTKSIIKSIKKKNHLPVTIPLLKGMELQDINTIEEIILSQVDEYLNNHIGVHSKRNLEDLIHVLEAKRSVQFIKKLKRSLKSSFGHRKDILHVLSTI